MDFRTYELSDTLPPSTCNEILSLGDEVVALPDSSCLLKSAVPVYPTAEAVEPRSRRTKYQYLGRSIYLRPTAVD